MRSRSHQLSQLSNQGFSLTELIFCCGLLATIMSLAVPNFSEFTLRKELDAAVIKIQRTLSLARSNALSHGKTVLICQLESPNSSHCVQSHKRNTRWKHGWLVFVDNDDNNALDDNDIILKYFETTENISLIFNQNGKLRFFSDGSSRSAGFYLCSEKSKEVKHLKLLHSGRTRLVKNTDKSRLNTCKNTLQQA